MMYVSAYSTWLLVAVSIMVVTGLQIPKFHSRLPFVRNYRQTDQSSPNQQQQQQQQQQPKQQQFDQVKKGAKVHLPHKHPQARSSPKRKLSNFFRPRIPIQSSRDLRNAILFQGHRLSDIDTSPIIFDDSPIPASHEVLRALQQQQQQTDNTINNNTSSPPKIALVIEGGGMRGAVSAGMAAAVCGLGLMDRIDSVYGSSAGAIVGAYTTLRQIHVVDVYTSILTQAKDKFVSKTRLFCNCLLNAWEEGVLQLHHNNREQSNKQQQPGMNLTFVMDDILDPSTGCRPLDLEQLHHRQQHPKQQHHHHHHCSQQSLFPGPSCQVVTSAVDMRTGELLTKCFGTQQDELMNTLTSPTTGRHGILACLEASMTVPGATGPPIELEFQETATTTSSSSSSSRSTQATNRNKNSTSDNGAAHGNNNHRHLAAFDGFCFEPLPYRSAVYEGDATHVIVLKSRPNDYVPKTQPTIYESVVAPLYFESHKLPNVATFFQQGGQQYIYLEDFLTLEEGKYGAPVSIPPNKILYGLGDHSNTNHHSGNNNKYKRLREEGEGQQQQQGENSANTIHTDQWKQAYVLPIAVPSGTPELSTLEQDPPKVIEAVQAGFAAAYNVLAPAIIGKDHVDGMLVAQELFPTETASGTGAAKEQYSNNRNGGREEHQGQSTKQQHGHNGDESVVKPTSKRKVDLLEALPGIQKIPGLANGIGL